MTLAMLYDAALVTLQLAILYLQEGVHTAELKPPGRPGGADLRRGRATLRMPLWVTASLRPCNPVPKPTA
jgi:hypothetical protein